MIANLIFSGANIIPPDQSSFALIQFEQKISWCRMINGLTMFNTFRTSSIWQDIFLVDTDWNCATRITPFISALYLALHSHCWVSVCSPWASSLQSTYYHLFSFLLQLLLLSRFCLLFHLFCFFSGLLYFGTSLNLMSNLLLLLVTSIALLLTSCRSTKPITFTSR